MSREQLDAFLSELRAVLRQRHFNVDPVRPTPPIDPTGTRKECKRYYVTTKAYRAGVAATGADIVAEFDSTHALSGPRLRWLKLEWNGPRGNETESFYVLMENL